MKTTVDIPDLLLEDAMKFSGAKTKKEAILVALEKYNHKMRVEAALKLKGSIPDFPSNDEIEAEDIKQSQARAKTWKARSHVSDSHR